MALVRIALAPPSVAAAAGPQAVNGRDRPTPESLKPKPGALLRVEAQSYHVFGRYVLRLGGALPSKGHGR